MVTTSQNNIVFLEPDVLINTIKTIEKNLPGWWWSISQRFANLTISAGPGRNAPNAHDVVLATTATAGTLGDAGIIHSLFYPSHKYDDTVSDFTNQLILLVQPHRDAASQNTEEMEKVVVEKTYRKQDEYGFQILKDAYTVFLSQVSSFETHGFVFDEIYLGSCEVSVDCSLRGTKPNGEKFDVSYDYEDALYLANSLSDALEELRNDVKEFNSQKKE